MARDRVDGRASGAVRVSAALSSELREAGADRVRLLWRALPWALYTACSRCGDVGYCRGKRREAMLCLECFAALGPRGRGRGCRKRRKQGPA